MMSCLGSIDSGVVSGVLHAIALALVGCGGEATQEVAPEPAEEITQPEIAPSETMRDFVDVDAASLRATLAAHPGRLLLVNVWSTWCEPCVEEMPSLISTAREYEDRGLSLVLIATEAPRNRDAAWAFLEEQRAPTPRYFKTGSDDAFITALSDEWTGALPATFLMDSDRTVRQFWPEPVQPENLRVAIEAALAAEGEP